MIKKIALIAAVLVSLSSTTVANTSNHKLVDLVTKQQALLETMVSTYGKTDKLDLFSSTIKVFEDGQIKLKNSINDPDIVNLLTFLNIRLNDLKSLASKPYSTKNRQLFVDVSNSLVEGSIYVKNSLKSNA